jgi:hypothetical protein
MYRTVLIPRAVYLLLPPTDLEALCKQEVKVKAELRVVKVPLDVHRNPCKDWETY